MKINELNGKKILILGYGKEGKATEEYIRRKAHPLVLDSADRLTDEKYLERQKDYDLVVRTPGIPKRKITVPCTTATNLFFANCGGTIVGVTGTKGKSTTASLIHHILEESGKKSRLIGNIGIPALSALMQPGSRDEVFVMELSSYQLDDVAYSPHISVILNLFPEHMDYHGDVSAYYAAKERIVSFSTKDDFLIYHSGYAKLRELAKRINCKSIAYNDEVFYGTPRFLPGEHNADNLKAAAAVCRLLNISEDQTVKAASTFRTLPHRLEYVGTYRNIRFYDDAISTTPQSTIAAIHTVDAVGTLFLGGLNRGYDYRDLVAFISEKKIPNLVLFPDAGAEIRNLVSREKRYVPLILETRSMEEAVRFGYKHSPANSACLLSTAAPSYSVWKNFEEKGDLFKHFVLTYAEKPTDE